MPKTIRFVTLLPVLVAMWAGPLAGQAAAQTFPAVPASLGGIPDSFGECGTDGAPLSVTVPVTGVLGGVTAVSVNMVVSHTWMGEITATLVSPDGTAHLLFGRTRADAPPYWGTDNDLDGASLTFNDGGAANWWAAALNNPVPGGVYRTTAIGGFPGATGPVTAMDPVFNNREPNGNWYVRFTDSCRLDVGVVSALSVTLNSTGVPGPVVSAAPDNYLAGLNTPLSIPAPGVLANDVNSPGSGNLVATIATQPGHGTVTLNANGSFLYTPATGYLGADSFTYTASNTALPGSTAPVTVSIMVLPVQPPTNFRVDRVSGSLVTLRWDAPLNGPVPTGYFLEGGTAPGSVMATAVTGPAAALTFSAPTGSFFVRARALDGAMTSGVSNEITLHVNVPVTPSAPLTLTGLVNADALALTWKLGYAGGEPTNVLLDISGGASLSVPVGPTESFAFTGVPAGTYTFSVRALNAGGVSTSSGPVTLTFPGACSGVPLPPRNYLFYASGNILYLLWDPPATGPAASAYVMNVTGAYVGAIPVGPSRNLSGAVPPGTYGVSVTALNACGASAPTAVQTVQVP